MDKTIVKIKSTNESSYPIIYGEGLINNAFDFIKQYTKANKFLVVTNETVMPLYGSKLKKDNVEFLILPDGEVYKTMQTLNKIIDKALEVKLERKDAIIALGGGVIGDMSGFASAVYQRGIDFIQIPTTLLAQVDSSVGGKVAVNHPSGKNMIGAFYQPKLVLTDTSTLNTLDERQFKTGMSEVVKYAFIEKTCNANQIYNFMDFLKKNKELIILKDHQILAKLIKICCELKSAVVNQDEKDKGLRAILNFGHTYAHAIEKITDYKKYTHGEAVSIGMKMIFDFALKINSISKEYYKEAIDLINDYGLITRLDFMPDENAFYNAMLSDKKIENSQIKLIIPKSRQEVKIEAVFDKKLLLEGIL